MPARSGRGTRGPRPRIVGAMILTAGALVAREMVGPRPNETASLVDWERVRRRAIRGSGESGPTHLVFSAGELGRRYDEMLLTLRPWIAEALDQHLPDRPFPGFTVL